MLSFNGNKMITTSGGGAFIAANAEEWNEVMRYATHIAHHRHIAELYGKAFEGIPGLEFHKGPDWAAEGSNYWLNTITIDPSVHVVGQEHAYEKKVEGAVGGAAGVLHDAADPHTDCEPNANVEALRVWLDKAGIEARPLWKPMHKQPVYAGADVYTNGVEVELFKVGMCLPSGPCVTDEDVAYIVECIRRAIYANDSRLYEEKT